MGIPEAILYGIIQGIAEFLPVSSSGHLALAQNFFGTGSGGNFAFNVALHLATLFSVCCVYRKDVYSMIKGFCSLSGKLFKGKLFSVRPEGGEKTFIAVAVATLPLVPIKLFGLDGAVERLYGINIAVGALLIANGIMLAVCGRIPEGSEEVAGGGYLRPLGIGLVQAFFGILPGISRSGSTITAGRAAGYRREEAVRFSFLLSVPAIGGACVSELPQAFSEGAESVPAPAFLAGATAAALTGFAAIKLVKLLSKKGGFIGFAVYSAAIGTAAVIADVLK